MLKVLVVDDSLVLRKNITKMFTELSHEIIGEAKNGIEGVAMFQDLNPDLVTMDITMPDMDGIEAVTKIMEIDPDAKVIMATSHGQEEMVIKAVQAGASGYILKPITREKLEETLSKALPKS
ncbi:MAG: response regulator [Campylobacterales bacterium]|nr:response regulator [Campylobacterales bacterium]